MQNNEKPFKPRHIVFVVVVIKSLTIAPFDHVGVGFSFTQAPHAPDGDCRWRAIAYVRKVPLANLLALIL